MRPVAGWRALVAALPNFRRGPHVVAAAGYAGACREVLAEFPAPVAVSVRQATRTMRVREPGLDLAHLGDAGHRRYAAAFLTVLAGTGRFPAPRQATPKPAHEW